MITINMVKKGYDAGLVRLMESPNGDGVVCGIGDNWFYFGGETAEGMTVEEYGRVVPEEDILNEIFQVLEDFRKTGDVFEDEYLYYDAFLSENLMDYASPVTAKKAMDFIQGNPAMARAIFYEMQKRYDREDIVSRIEKNDDFDINGFSSEDVDKIAERFNETLGNNDTYWDVYWAIADSCIEDFLKEKEEKGVFSVSMEDCGTIVDAALHTIRGAGVDMGSGCYDLNSFEFDSEKLNLYIDVCKLEDEGAFCYAVYYAVEYADGDNLLHGWTHTGGLDVNELKKVVYRIANMDFSEAIREALKGNVSQALDDAQKRSVDVQEKWIKSNRQGKESPEAMI